MANIFSKCSECINTHQNASKCMQNELCKCFVQENIKEVVFITFKWAKIDELLVSLCDGRPCISEFFPIELKGSTLSFRWDFRIFFNLEISQFKTPGE